MRRRFYIRGAHRGLELRLAAHRARRYSGYTSKRLPVSLIFSSDFGTRDEAFTAERQIKGWSRAKKLALARGEWDVVVQLASVRSPDRLRTSTLFGAGERV